MKREEDIVGFLESIGIVKRKLTRKEAREITETVMKLKDPDARFQLACALAFQKIC